MEQYGRSLCLEVAALSASQELDGSGANVREGWGHVQSTTIDHKSAQVGSSDPLSSSRLLSLSPLIAIFYVILHETACNMSNP